VLFDECNVQSIRTDRNEKLLEAFVDKCARAPRVCTREAHATYLYQSVADKPLVAQARQQRVNDDDFEKLKLIGRGGYGSVRTKPLWIHPSTKSYAHSSSMCRLNLSERSVRAGLAP
jgi:hypothetical protein